MEFRPRADRSPPPAHRGRRHPVRELRLFEHAGQCPAGICGEITMRLLIFLAALFVASAPAAKTLDIYTIDVEGGKSVLIVSPSGESMLFDVGWPKSNTREASADRIVEAAQSAGLKQIDYLVISHFDVDHLGDVPLLVSKLPV